MSTNQKEGRRDVQNDLFNLSRVDRMWQIPTTSRAPNTWHIPKGTIIGLSSRNDEKIQTARKAIENDYHGKIVKPAVGIPERGIKEMLRIRWEIDNDMRGIRLFDARRVVKIAALKAFTFFKDETVTYGLGLDTDVFIMGPDEEGPLGMPKNREELYEMLEKISGKNIKIVSAGALVDFKKKRVVAIEALNIMLKLRDFKPEEFIEVFSDSTVGEIAGAIDYSDFCSTPFLDANSPVIINRIDQSNQEDDRFDQPEREVWLTPSEAPPILRECVKGSPQLIKWLIYNGLTNPRIINL